MLHIVVLNPKGGSGKTTIATNLAASLASSGRSPTLMDMDPQGLSTHWLSKRASHHPGIHGLADLSRSAQTGTGIHEMPRWQVRQDIETWEPLMQWLEKKRSVRAS